MIIDWYTVIFQIINFLILVFLLHRFLYGPIIQAMDDREQKITDREKEATRKQDEAARELEAYQRKSDDLQRNKEGILEEARSAAAEEKQTLLQEARSEVNEARRRWEKAFEREKDTFTDELRLRIGRQACSIARRCLHDLADASLEEMIWDIFFGKLKDIPSAERSQLGEALSAARGRVNLRSAFEISRQDIARLTDALEALWEDGKPELVVQLDPDLLCGLEIETGGYRVAWNVEDYLAEVENKILTGLHQLQPVGEPGEVENGDQ